MILAILLIFFAIPLHTSYTSSDFEQEFEVHLRNLQIIRKVLDQNGLNKRYLSCIKKIETHFSELQKEYHTCLYFDEKTKQLYHDILSHLESIPGSDKAIFQCARKIDGYWLPLTARSGISRPLSVSHRVSIYSQDVSYIPNYMRSHYELSQEDPEESWQDLVERIKKYKKNNELNNNEFNVSQKIQRATIIKEFIRLQNNKCSCSNVTISDQIMDFLKAPEIFPLLEQMHEKNSLTECVADKKYAAKYFYDKHLVLQAQDDQEKFDDEFSQQPLQSLGYFCKHIESNEAAIEKAMEDQIIKIERPFLQGLRESKNLQQRYKKIADCRWEIDAEVSSSHFLMKGPLFELSKSVHRDEFVCTAHAKTALSSLITDEVADTLKQNELIAGVECNKLKKSVAENLLTLIVNREKAEIAHRNLQRSLAYEAKQVVDKKHSKTIKESVKQQKTVEESKEMERSVVLVESENNDFFLLSCFSCLCSKK